MTVNKKTERHGSPAQDGAPKLCGTSPHRNRMHRFSPSKHGSLAVFCVLGLVAVSLLPLIVHLFSPGLAKSIDWHLHACWSSGFAQSLGEGVLVPRWLAHVNAGYGAPVFVYYPPLAYYLLSAGAMLGDFNIAWKLLTAFSAILLAAGVYCWVRMTGSRHAAVAGAAAALCAPAVWWAAWRYNLPAQTLAIALVPWLLAGAERCRKAGSLGPLWLAVGVLLQLVTHFPSALVSATVLAAYLSWLGAIADWRSVGRMLVGCLLGMACASWVWVPALLEASLVHLEFVRQGPWDIQKNLLFLQGGMAAFPRDSLAWNVLAGGTVLAVLLLAVSRMLVERTWRITTGTQAGWLISLAVVFALSSAITAPVYHVVPALAFVQFGWRWQPVVAILAIRVFATWLDRNDPHRRELLLAATLIAGWGCAAVFLTTGNGPLDLQKLDRTTASELEWAATTCPWPTLEHRPRSMGARWESDLGATMKGEVEALRGRVNVESSSTANHRREYEIDSEFDALVRLRHLNFAGWQATIDDEPAKIETGSDGAMTVHVPPGKHTLVLRFGSTAVRDIAAVVSVTSALLLLSIAVLGAVRGRRRYKVSRRHE